MSKADSSSLKRLLGILFLAVLIGGIACTGWALANIKGGGPYPAGSYVARPSAATTSVPEPVESSVTVTVAIPYPTKGERIGTLWIPALRRQLPIVEGADDSQLDKGVGHYIESVMPGQPDNCVLAGHRDTVFAGLGKLQRGDQLVVKMATGVYTYEIARTRIVHKNDRTVIVPSTQAVLTLSTCYPFNYIGFAPDRYIIIADLVASE